MFAMMNEKFPSFPNIYESKTLKMETFSDFEAVVSAICVINEYDLH